MRHKLSIVVPVYNNEQFLKETIQSILDQTFKDFELILSDHSSTDHSLEIMNGFLSDSRVRIMSVSPGGGKEKLGHGLSSSNRRAP